MGIAEERQKVNQSKVIRSDYKVKLAEIEEWLSKAADVTSHHRDDTSDSVAQAIQVNIHNKILNIKI